MSAFLSADLYNSYTLLKQLVIVRLGKLSILDEVEVSTCKIHCRDVVTREQKFILSMRPSLAHRTTAFKTLPVPPRSIADVGHLRPILCVFGHQ